MSTPLHPRWLDMDYWRWMATKAHDHKRDAVRLWHYERAKRQQEKQA